MKKVLSFLLALALCAGLGVPALAAGFSDVPPGHYAASAIDDCVAKGVVSGYADGTFKPAAPVTRAQFCVMIARAFCPEEIAKYANPQGSRLAWYAPNTKALYFERVLDDTILYFSYLNRTVMDEPINRYEMAQLMSNLLTRRGFQADPAQLAAAQAGIKDWSAIPEEWRKAVSTCYALGVLGGLGDGTFGGEKPMTRAQGCVVIDRLSRYVQPGAPSEESAPIESAASQTPAQPSQSSSQPSQPSQPAADPSKFPEERCLSCGYLMRAAGSPKLDKNNGGASGGYYTSCDLCKRAVMCQQCSDLYADVALTLRRHKAVCASGGGLAPMADFCSPYYRDSVFHQRLKSVQLTGDYRRDILAVAASQIGYTEGSDATDLDGSGNSRGNYAEYNWVFSEDAGGAWCSEFASWCARQADVPVNILRSSRTACPDNFGGTAYSWQDTVFAGGYYMPQPGDLMLICHSSRSVSTSDDMDHTTIVESVDWTGDTVRINVIDGNSNSTVRRHDYTYDASQGMTGYFVAPDYP